MTEEIEPDTSAETAGGDVVGQVQDEVTPDKVTDTLHPEDEPAGEPQPTDPPREGKDTGDVVDPDAEDPTPDEVTDPADPSYVQPFPAATSVIGTHSITPEDD